MPLRIALVILSAWLVSSCIPRRGPVLVPTPEIISHAAWQTQPPTGHAADATRRDLKAGDSLSFRDLTITVVATAVDSSAAKAEDVVRRRLSRGAARDERDAREGVASYWEGFHLVVVAIYGPGEFGAGLVAIEAATVGSVPAAVATSDSAGGAELWFRIPHRITHVTLHHTGSPEPLRPDEDPREKLRGLQSWGATPAQVEPIANLMAWAVARFDVPVERIGGHYDYAQTGCPGKHLRTYLEDGTLRRMVLARLDGR